MIDFMQFGIEYECNEMIESWLLKLIVRGSQAKHRQNTRSFWAFSICLEWMNGNRCHAPKKFEFCN